MPFSWHEHLDTPFGFVKGKDFQKQCTIWQCEKIFEGSYKEEVSLVHTL